MIVFFLAVCFFAKAQKPEDVYRKPLDVVLKDVEKKYKVTLNYDEHTVKGLNVSYATWRFTSDIKTTLDIILHPLDLN